MAKPETRRVRWTAGDIRRKLHLDFWFPHGPLALALAFLGFALLTKVGLGELSLHSLSEIPLQSIGALKTAIPQTVLGIVMLTMSLGLVLRSRFSWTVSILLTMATLVFMFRFQHTAFSLIAWFDAALLLALLLSRRAFHRSSVTAGSLFALTSVCLLLMYAVFGALYLGEEFSQPIKDVATALYFAIVTMSTVGYGDITPVTSDARLFTVSITVLGITVFATSISAVILPIASGSFKKIMASKGTNMTRKDHYVIIGATPLAANTYRELQARKQQVTLILSQPPIAGEYDGADVLVGDATDVGVLQQAGADRAKAVMAMRADDSDNAFIILAVKELGGSAKTVTAVNDAKHLARVKRVHPDILISPQILGGELLAMALTGENITGEFVMDRVLHFET